MFFPWTDPSVRLTGRWSYLDQKITASHPLLSSALKCTITTAPGSYLELAFKGTTALLQFDISLMGQPAPHLWICVDNQNQVEVPVDRYIRVNADTYGVHTLRVIYKGGSEVLPRWYLPVMGAVSFVGFHAEEAAELPPDQRFLIEFIGDSITEGVLIDPDLRGDISNDQFNRPYQDDSTATYAALTAHRLNLRAMYQAYGAVGLTRKGNASVPRAGLIYPYVFDSTPYFGEKPHVLVINYGTNDRTAPESEFLMRYAELVDQIRSDNPNAVVVCLTPFVGAFNDTIREFVESYNLNHSSSIHYVSSKDWIPAEPIHPLRDGHQIVADHFAPILDGILKEELPGYCQQ